MNLVLMFGAVTSIEKITDKKEEVSFINKGKEFKFTFDYSDENCEFKPLNVADWIGIRGEITDGKLEVKKYQSYGEFKESDLINQMNFCSFIGIVNELKRVDKNTVIAKIAVESKPNILDRIIKLRVPDDILFKNWNDNGIKVNDVIGAKGYLSINENNECYVETYTMQNFEEEKLSYFEYLKTTPLDKDLENIENELDKENAKEHQKDLNIVVNRERE